MTRLIVVGSGIAGLTAALTAASAGADVTVVTKRGLADSNTRYAQGGIAVALAADDSPALHASDTLAVGGGLGDPDAVAALCSEGPARVRELIARGVAFDRAGDDFARGLEAAHSRHRILHAGGDATGAAIEAALVAEVRAVADGARRPGPAHGGGITVMEHTALADLVVADGRIRGVEVLAAGTGDTRALEADAVVIASGGAGRLYSHTTNPDVATGDGTAAAWRAGARLVDLEFYQFHPTHLAAGGGFLVSEAVRGEGAVLRDAAGRRFMVGEHPDAELAPRDVVARGIARAMARQGGAAVQLDATMLGAEFLARRFPTIDRAVRAAGLDWGREPIPVTPAAHYWMGGIATDLHGRTGVPGLYAAGEAACTGVHGANRLASNSLLEGAVFGHRAALAALDTAAPDPAASHRDAGATAPDPLLPSPAASASAEETAREAAGIRTSAAARLDRARLQSLMWQGAGVERSAAGLADAAAGIRALASDGADAPDATAAADPVTALENRNLLQLALLLVGAASERRESRGAHFRIDHPAASARPVRRPAPSAGHGRPGATRSLRHDTTREAVPAC